MAQSGYLANHNMNPDVVGSPSFGVLWSKVFNSLEKVYAKPLVYTPSGGAELVITASNQNWVRVHDAKTGALVASRQLTSPFLKSDIPCGDIPDTIGVTGTPIIDPDTGIM